MNKEELIEVFLDTQDKSVAMYPGDTSKSEKINTSQLYGFKPYSPISVENIDSVSCLQKYDWLGKTAVLNMASYKRPGGGVRRGSKAQEECLFRCSNLITMVPESMYPLKDTEAIYTRDVTFFKNFEYDMMSSVMTDVVTIAAINRSNEENNESFSTYVSKTRSKIRMMIAVALFNEVEVLILGAWGCGVFKNDPELIACLFRDILNEKDFKNQFLKVIFPVINDHNSVANNYEIFKSILEPQ